MNQLLKFAIENNVSDVHITENKEGWLRISGTLTKDDRIIKTENITEFIELVIPSVYVAYREMLKGERTRPIDAAFKYMFRRFRINIYKGMDGISLAIRLLSDGIQSTDSLFLPDEVKKFTKIKSGLFLVVGTTGSGKSTTLASLIDAINHERQENILTIEQPIEYLHKSDKSRITQTEVGAHIESFEEATRAAMRQDPDIILVGEMRDLETIQNALTLAETGHAVFATLHAKSVTDTIDRIVDVFPSSQQEQIRCQLAKVLAGVLHQSLIRGTNGSVVPLAEQLVVDDVVAAMILAKQKSNSIRDRLRGQSGVGNVHIADNAIWHIQNKRLSADSVVRYMSPDDYSIVRTTLGSQTQRKGFS